MTEKLLQYIWQFKYFQKSELKTTTDESIQILYNGILNTNQGPDFLEAKIKIEKTILVGSIELHLKTSDWKNHHHSKDKNYKNVILHVVWENDEKESAIPVLELNQRVPKILLTNINEWMNSTNFIPCEKSINLVSPLVWLGWKDRLVAERLERKSLQIETYLLENNFHWEETLWWMLARNFGLKTNEIAFEQIARSISINQLYKHKNNILQLEALLFGQANLLEKKFKNSYALSLQKEFHFLKTKYKLKPIFQAVHFLRMRPANFPTIRLAQLASLISKSSHLFEKIKNANSIEIIQQLFTVQTSSFWETHYNFEEPSLSKTKNLGTAMINNICINTVIPLLFTYGNYHKDSQILQKLSLFLGSIKAEKNSITNGFEKIKIANKNALDSQAFVELRNEYCSKKRCLDCVIGNKILMNKNN